MRDVTICLKIDGEGREGAVEEKKRGARRAVKVLLVQAKKIEERIFCQHRRRTYLYALTFCSLKERTFDISELLADGTLISAAEDAEISSCCGQSRHV